VVRRTNKPRDLEQAPVIIAISAHGMNTATNQTKLTLPPPLLRSQVLADLGAGQAVAG
jgi:hypothetical protein